MTLATSACVCFCLQNTCRAPTCLHWEVRVRLVVVEDIADHLVEHGEEGTEGSQSGKVHHVVKGLRIL